MAVPGVMPLQVTGGSHRRILTPLSVPGGGTAPATPRQPVAGAPTPGPAAGWVGLEAVPGGQAGSAELRLALYANGSVIIYSFGIHYNRIICDRLI